MQVCHNSDRLSAVFGSNTDRDVSVPYLLEDDNFDADKVFQAVKAVTPKCLWMSTSEHSPVESSSWLMNAAADWQVHNDQYFVLAINYKSQVWESPYIHELLSQPYVFHTTVNMRSYEKRSDEKRRQTMCLVHNIPGDYISYLGSAKPTKETYPDKSKLRWFFR